MNRLDVVIVILILAALMAGLAAGIVRLALGVVSIVAGFAVAVLFADPVASFVGGWIRSPELALLVSFVGCFAVVLVAFALLGWGLRALLQRIGLRWADRVVGALVSAGLVGVAISGVALILARTTADAAMVKESRVLPVLARLGGDVADALPSTWQKEGRRLVEALVRRRTAGGDAPGQKPDRRAGAGSKP